MQPVQLSLIPDLVAPPPGVLVGEIAAEALTEAVAVLAIVIAKAVAPAPRRASDE